MKRLLFVILCSLFLPLSGCSEKLQGFGGNVTYGGKPLEQGSITFTPDAEHGNLMGASNVAAVKDGRYELPVNQGISGGWYRVSVESTEHVDGAEGGSEKHLIPPYSFSHEFKPDEKTFDIEIPAARK
jgi:hypothetical protein